MPVFKAVDLFCSAGGLSLGLQASLNSLGAGLRVLGAVDIDTRALETYSRNFRPSTGFNGSVNDLVRYSLQQVDQSWQFSNEPVVLPPFRDYLGKVDILIGGPPCQGHSNFNNKSRRDDPRNSLYVSAVALAIGMGVSAVVLENVPDVRRSHFEVVEIGKSLLTRAGYQVTEFVLTASDFGWPQTRKRHFLVGSRYGLTSYEDLMKEFSGDAPGSAEFFDLVPKRSDLLESLPEYSQDTIRRLEYFRANPDAYDLPLSERPTCHQSGTTYTSVYGRMRPDQPIPTLTTGFMTPGRGRFIHPTELRTLTPGEAAFVQGFPSWFDFGESSCSRSDLTKWIGDAVPLPLGFVATQSVVKGLLG